jgi:hypothetical protein
MLKRRFRIFINLKGKEENVRVSQADQIPPNIHAMVLEYYLLLLSFDLF